MLMWEFKLEVLQWKENCTLQKSAEGQASKNDDIMSVSRSLIG